MRIIIPKASVNKQWKYQLLQDFAMGISCHGDEVVVTPEYEFPCMEQLFACTGGAFYGVFKYDRLGHDQRQQVKQTLGYFYSKNIVIETPLIDRQEPLTEFRVGVNGHVRNNASWCWDSVDDGRVKKFYSGRSFDTKRQWRNKKGKNILVPMQNHDDLINHGIDVYSWLLALINDIKKHTDRPIVLRSNPFHAKNESSLITSFQKKIYGIPGVEMVYSGRGIPTRSLEQDLEEAWCVVCHSSGVSVDAVIRGIPVICLGEQCMAWEVCGHDLSQIEHPITPDPVPWFEKMAMIQYSQEEFRSGECWNYIRPLCS